MLEAEASMNAASLLSGSARACGRVGCERRAVPRGSWTV